MLINQKEVKKLALSFGAKRHHKLTRVSKSFLESMDFMLRGMIQRHVEGLPSVGKTIMILAVLFTAGVSTAHAYYVEDELALRTILGEARGEPYEGQCAVGEVLRRNPNIPFFGTDTIKNDGRTWFALERKRWVPLTDEVVERAQKAWVESEKSNYSLGATNFEGDMFKRPTWSYKMKLVAHIGHQLFFKEAKS